MNGSFDKLQRTWQALGQEDPLWAVLSHEGKRGGGWDPEEFFRTGDLCVDLLHGVLRARANVTAMPEHVLDFGCGVGRLSRAWGRRAKRVTGVDISEAMVERGNAFLRDVPNVKLVTNASPDLLQWPDVRFDLVFSYICLQHMPWDIARRYLGEFARVCRPDGCVAFQLPARQLGSGRAARMRRRLVESLPLGLGRLYRRWRHGSGAVFEMHFTAPAEVEREALHRGLRLAHREPDAAAGSGTEGYFYAFRKAPC